ncbi:t-SNARE VTI1 [Umbelopsis nana]
MASSTEGSDLFASYEQDFSTICDAIRNKIDKQISSQSGEQRKATVRAAEREIDEADEIIAQMEMEILNIPTASRTRLQTKLRLFKSEFEKIKRDLRRATTQVPPSSSREELFGGLESGDGDLDASTVDQRSRLLSGTDRLGESSRRLQDSHRLALETENVGINILGTLKGQRETILRSRDTLAEADSHIDKASKTLKGMARRMATNKMITVAIILVLIALIVLIIWSKFG